MIELTTLQEDALNEIINIGIGKAMSLFNELLETHITLSVPDIHFYYFHELDEMMKSFQENHLTSISQPFKGEFKGKCSLVFPKDSALKIVSVLTDEDVDSPEIDSIANGTLLEIGNILNNAILGTISNMLKCNLHFSLPEYNDISILKSIIDTISKESVNEGIVLFGEVNFFIESLKVDGFILLFFEVKSLKELMKIID